MFVSRDMRRTRETCLVGVAAPHKTRDWGRKKISTTLCEGGGNNSYLYCWHLLQGGRKTVRWISGSIEGGLKSSIILAVCARDTSLAASSNTQLEVHKSSAAARMLCDTPAMKGMKATEPILLPFTIIKGAKELREAEKNLLKAFLHFQEEQ